MTINIDKKTVIAHFSKHKKSVSDNPVFANHTLAAVLVPIIDDPQGLQVLLTRRTLHLKHHAGQISFPGGMLENSDQTLVDTAIREAQEEIGLVREQIQLLGSLEPLMSSTQFLVTPFVGLITPPLNLKLDAHEVAEAFMVPLNFALDRANQKKEVYMHENQSKEIDVIAYKEHRIWGLTARILVNLSQSFID